MQENKNFKDEVDFRELATNPKKLIGIVYFLFVAAVIAVGLFFVNNFQYEYKNTVPNWGGRADNTFKDIEMKKGVAQAGINPLELMKATPELIAKGKESYTKACASCHGESGKGDGPAGGALNPKPRDFSSPQGWKNGPSFAGIFKTLQEGLPGTGMTAFEYLPAEERFAIIHYVRSLGNHFPEISENEMTELDKQYSLSKGSAGASRIPVQLAMMKLASENLSAPVRAKSVLDYINAHPNEQPAEVFNKLFVLKEEALKHLNKNTSWTYSLSAFTAAVASMPAGYKAQGVELTREEWNVLHQYLARFYKGIIEGGNDAEKANDLTNEQNNRKM